MLSISIRVKFSSAREGHLPEILSMVSISRNTPLPAILSCVLLLVYLIEDDIIALVEYLGFIDVVFESVTIAIVPYYRWKYPDIPRPYKVRLLLICGSQCRPGGGGYQFSKVTMHVAHEASFAIRMTASVIIIMTIFIIFFSLSFILLLLLLLILVVVL